MATTEGCSVAEVTNEPMYDVSKQVRSDISGLKDSWRENAAALNAIRTHMIGQSQDFQNIYTILARCDARLERIERRLDIVVEPA
jgi:hypothetical protein